MINTPLGQKSCNVFDEDVVLIPILRAGISMLHGFQKILPTSKTGFILAHRDSFANAHIDYYKLPNVSGKTVIILDPMLATAGTVNAAVEIIKKDMPFQIFSASILSTSVGLSNRFLLYDRFY